MIGTSASPSSRRPDLNSGDLSSVHIIKLITITNAENTGSIKKGRRRRARLNSLSLFPRAHHNKIPTRAKYGIPPITPDIVMTITSHCSDSGKGESTRNNEAKSAGVANGRAKEIL